MCKRPAVSIKTKSAPISKPLATASKAIAAGSAPSLPETNVAPALAAHVLTWPVAAARNVSAAPITTLLPVATK